MQSKARIVCVLMSFYCGAGALACGPAEAELDTRFNADGTWPGYSGAAAISFGVNNGLAFNGVVTDVENSIYLGGFINGFFDGDFFALKLTATGLPVWSSVLPIFSGANAQGIALDNSGCVYLGGYTDPPGGGFDSQFAAAKLSDTGGLIWTAVLPAFFSGSDDQANGIALDSSGCVYLGGYVNPPGGGLDSHFAAAKLSDTGGLIWTAVLPLFSSGSFDEANGIALDSSGCVYLGGSTNPPGGGFDPYFAAAKLSDAGGLIWTAVLPAFFSGSNDQANGIALDSSGCVYLGGFIDLPGGGFERQFAAAKLSDVGSLIWTAVVPSFSPGSEDVANGIALDSSGCVYLGGYANGGSARFAAAKLNTQGGVVWTAVLPSVVAGSNFANGITLDSEDAVLLAGLVPIGYNLEGLVAKLVQRAIVPPPPPLNPLLASSFIPMAAG